MRYYRVTDERKFEMIVVRLLLCMVAAVFGFLGYCAIQYAAAQEDSGSPTERRDVQIGNAFGALLIVVGMLFFFMAVKV